MSLSGSLQLSYDLGLCRNQGYNKKFKSVLGRGKLHLLSATLLSRASSCNRILGEFASPTVCTGQYILFHTETITLGVMLFKYQAKYLNFLV